MQTHHLQAYLTDSPVRLLLYNAQHTRRNTLCSNKASKHCCCCLAVVLLPLHKRIVKHACSRQRNHIWKAKNAAADRRVHSVRCDQTHHCQWQARSISCPTNQTMTPRQQLPNAQNQHGRACHTTDKHPSTMTAPPIPPGEYNSGSCTMWCMSVLDCNQQHHPSTSQHADAWPVFPDAAS
jgi:hypothetical protein